ncbi:hypothetical protein EVAR_67345_1, partial [Eumeta japonica]
KRINCFSTRCRALDQPVGGFSPKDHQEPPREAVRRATCAVSRVCDCGPIIV